MTEVSPSASTSRERMTAILLSPNNVDEIVDVLSDAFHDYPVMHYVLGPEEPYDGRLRRLIELFVHRHASRAQPMLGVRDGTGALLGVATLTSSRLGEPPPAFGALREATWAELGADARARYEAFVGVIHRFVLEAPHWYLDMLGVRRSHHGRGLARVLLEAVHEISRSDETSSGVTLTTERAANVGLYEHFGYRVLGHARVSDSVETWALFREERRGPAAGCRAGA